MHILPIHTPVIHAGNDLAAILAEHAHVQAGDIIVVSSKVIATVEGNAIDLSTLEASQEARDWSEKTGRSAAFCEAVLHEVRRLNGVVRGACPGALLTEVRPDGLQSGTILVANAGLDESNVTSGYAVGWPKDPAASANALKKRLTDMASGPVAVIVTDSCCTPRRIGVIAQALATAGLDPIENRIGTTDLFGRSMTITKEARADQLAVAANFLMGNAAQSVPAAIIRDHDTAFNDTYGWVSAIEPAEDLFSSML